MRKYIFRRLNARFWTASKKIGPPTSEPSFGPNYDFRDYWGNDIAE